MLSSEAVVNLPKNVTVPAVIAFGDSIVDQGNNNVIETIVKCNFPTYGKDFVGGPTGRFCNGKTPADLIAEQLGIKEYVPAYLDPHFQPSELLTGYDINSYTDLVINYASDFVKELYQLGLKRIGLFGAAPIGCLPSQRTLAGGELRVCSEIYNQAAQLMNSKLSSAITSYNNSLNDPKPGLSTLIFTILCLISS
ncbi:unnamed protein product [Camellia sinensis]